MDSALFFMSAGTGLLLGAASFYVAALLKPLLLSTALGAALVNLTSVAIPVPHAGRLLFALGFGPAVAIALNGLLWLGAWIAEVQEHSDLRTWVNKKLSARYGNLLAQVLRRGAEEQKLILLSLKSRKVYCGRILEVPVEMEPDTAYIEILPKFSGYRDKDTLRLSPDKTNYPAFIYWEARGYLATLNEMREQISLESTQTDLEARAAALTSIGAEILEVENVLHQTGEPESFDIDDWLKVIPVAEIEVASVFDESAFERWHPSSDDGRAGVTPSISK